MNDRPFPANGKRNASWGTLNTCGVCGRCLCYACHPRGPCADEHATAVQPHVTARPPADHPLGAQS